MLRKHITAKSILLWLSIFVTLYLIESTAVHFMGAPVWGETLWVLPIYYLWMMVLFIPVWYILFVRFKNAPLIVPLLLHLIFCPIYLYVWYSLNYKCLHLLKLSAFYPHDKVAIMNFYYISSLNYFLIFGMVHAYHFFLQRERLAKREKELQAATHLHELSALKAQIHPHFLFNTLNTISASVPASQEATREMIAWLADVFRYALKVVNLSHIPIEEEVEFMRAVLLLEQKRFKKRLSFSINLENELRNYMITPLLMQPLLENAIKHGITPSIEGGHVDIEIAREGGKVRIALSNTGISYEGDLGHIYDTKGIGLINTKKRLALIYGSKLSIQKNNPSGLIISFELPLNKGGFYYEQDKKNIADISR